MLRGALAIAGEVGYREVSAERIAARGGYSVAQFYALFASPEECFSIAYEEQAEILLAKMLRAVAAAPGSREGIRAILVELTEFVSREPTLARALLTEVYVAGGAAAARHEQNLRRLSDAVAGTRRESGCSHDPPPITASFIVGGIEEAVRRRLVEKRPEALWEDLPELASLVVGPYLGDEAAEAERRRPADDSD
ncbi:MAG TPA: TetR/AcrR family transcriptional regulator [Solirubrobacterales bacterium]|nr:TetR/AcrR family transcriptional regulator [Solirubrobacterales bacterium]